LSSCKFFGLGLFSNANFVFQKVSVSSAPIGPFGGGPFGGGQDQQQGGGIDLLSLASTIFGLFTGGQNQAGGGFPFGRR
jgi:hypothetical protein